MQDLLIKIIISLLVTLIVSPRIAADSIKGIDTVEYNLGILAKDPDNKEALKALAFHYLNLGNYVEARKYGERLVALGEKTGDRDFCELYGKIVMGVTVNDENSKEAFTLLQEALSIAEASDNIDALVSIYNSLGIYYLFIHDDPYTAISNYYSALEYAKQIDDRRRQDIIATNIAGCYLSRNDASGLDLARDAYRSALEQDEAIPLYYAHRHLILFYLLTDSLDKAEEMINGLEELSSKLDITDDNDMVFEKARLYEKRGDVKNAYRYYAYAMENINNANQSWISALYLAYGRFLRNQNQLPSVINVLEHAISNHGQEGEDRMLIHIPEIMQELALCYREAGDNGKALEYSMKYQHHLDSAMNISRERTLQENRIKHDIFTRERKIKEQQVELLASRHRMTILTLVSVIFIVIMTLMWINYKKKDRIYSAIVSQNQDYIKREKMLQAQIDSQKEQLMQDHTPQQSSLHEDKINDLFTRFSTAMTEQKLYRDPSITVASVADALETNRTYLSKAINESTGKTFTQIVNDYRIREAIELISDIEANIPLKQIAAEVGFNYIATFYVTFQSVVGMTPAKYRAKLKEI